MRVLILSLIACHQPGPADLRPHEPLVTEPGSSLGEAVSAEIGPEGGELATPDGALTLTVPAGALAATTTLTAEPISNPAPGGLGDAWRLGPEGTVFDVAASLRLAVTDEDLGVSSSGGLGVAWQGDDGRWWWVDEPTATDEAVTVPTTHLSDWSKVAGVQLAPLAATVEAGGSQALTVVFCYDEYAGDGLASLVGYRCDSPDDVAPLVSTSDWSVNGVAGGDSTWGTVEGSGHTGTYSAPRKRPDPSTVAATVRVGAHAGVRPDTILYSQLTIGTPADMTGTFTLAWSDPIAATTFVIEADATLTQMDDGPDETNYELGGVAELKTTTFMFADAVCAADQGGIKKPITHQSYFKVRKQPEDAVRWSYAESWGFTCTGSMGTFPYGLFVSFGTFSGELCLGNADVPIADPDAPEGHFSMNCMGGARVATADWSFTSTP